MDAQQEAPEPPAPAPAPEVSARPPAPDPDPSAAPAEPLADPEPPADAEPPAAAAAGVDGTSTSRAPLVRQVFLALGLLLAYGFFLQQPAWNEYSRYDLVRAIVEEQTLRIDSFHENTGDKAFKDGHYYSDKAPGTAILGVPAYAAYRAVNAAFGAPEPPPQEQAVAFLAFVLAGIPTALLVVLLVRFLVPLTGEPWALFMGAAYGLGTIAFPFATMFFGHALSAFVLFAAFYLLHRWRRTRGRWEPYAAGLLGGWAVITEIPVGLGVAVLGVYALWLGWRVALRFAIGGLPVALLLGGYNWITFGSPLSLGYQYSTLFGEQNATGIVSIVLPTPERFLDLMFNPRGLLVLAPWLALAPLGLLAARRREIRAEVLVAAGMCVAFLAYNSGALNPFGGWTPGPRYLVPMLSFATVLVALAPRVIRPLTVALVAVSAAIMLAATATRPNAQELYENPLVQLWLPRLVSGHLADSLAWHRFGFSGPEPILLLLVGLAFVVAAILATRGTDRVSRAVTAVSGAILVLLVVAVALPVPGPAAWPASAQTVDGPPRIRMVADGAWRRTAGDQDTIVLWTQLANQGSAATTRIEFRAVPADGAPPDAADWKAWYGDVEIGAGERHATDLAWDLEGRDPRDYAWQIVVIDQATGEEVATSGAPQPMPAGLLP